MKTEGQKQSQKHERRLAKEMDGHVTPASGAFATAKGDVRTPEFLVEHKWTGKQQLTIKASVLEKICDEALMTGRMAVLGVHLNGYDYVLMTESEFHELRQRRV